MNTLKNTLGISFLIFGLTGQIFGVEPGSPADETVINNSAPQPLTKRGDFAYPTNPTNDRAIGYLLKGKIKSTILNYGDFIDIDVDRDGRWDKQPAGLWGEYAYIPQCGFIAGVPGMEYAHKYNWILEGDLSGSDYKVWSSNGAYRKMITIDGDTTFNYAGVVFETYEDDGIVGTKVESYLAFTLPNQWYVDHDDFDPNAGVLMISTTYGADPNLPNAYMDPNEKKGIGLIYPWALRPALQSRTPSSVFDFYDYSGCDGFNEDWDECANLEYYGATVSESWLTRRYDTDWQPTTNARQLTQNREVTAGDIFGETDFTDPNDPYPLLAHSNFSQTWPVNFNETTGDAVPFWPGWWAEDYAPEETGCVPATRKNPDCWVELPGTFVSDSDIYIEFDDRWAHRGNKVNSTGDKYLQKGYPMGLKVMSTAHSYGVSFAEDILFVTVKVRNESGDWCAFEKEPDGSIRDLSRCTDPAIYSKEACEAAGEIWEPLCGEGIVLPDGSKINGGKGYDYNKMFLGFYFDADAYSQTITGSTGGRTPSDDTMESYDSTIVVNNEELIISMAMIYDYDGISGPASGSDLGIVAVQLLDTPVATDTLYEDIHGINRLPGQKLKITDWHWFDWMNRPGVKNPGIEPPRAKNKEEIQFKLMSGDTTNITDSEQDWFFHSKEPSLDEMDPDFNPHFDSLEGLEKESVWSDGDEGLDCVLIASTGPFNIAVGEEVPFSFTIIFGEDKADLIKNAEFAQIMYNSHYQGFTPPTAPTVITKVDQGKVELYWDDAAELSTDVVTGYGDFEGYKLYKSIDGGKTWGGLEDMVYDTTGKHVGWRPMAQYDLNAEADSLHCIYTGGNCSGENRGRNITGPDPKAPWFYLGEDSGFDEVLMDTTDWDTIIVEGKETILKYKFTDEQVVDGMEYTYSVTAYDMGVEEPFTVTWIDQGDGTFIMDSTRTQSNPDNWGAYQSIENARGTTIHDRNFVTVVSGVPSDESLNKVWVVPNPYIVHSEFRENEYLRQIRFTNVPGHCEISIYTISGELVQTFRHDNELDGNEWWDLRTINNQEIAPGLYIFRVVSDSGKEFLGKFAVVR